MNIFKSRKSMRFMTASIVACSLLLHSCSPSGNVTTDASNIIGEWNILKAEGISTKDGANPATISFNAEGKVNGCASVNRFFGSYEFDGRNLSLGNLGVTRMMGPNMEIEDAVIKAINSTHSVRIKGDKASFFDNEGAKVMTLKKAGK